MNKMIKGSIAGATGVALLMGGFGTYALWTDSENLEASTITAGELDVAAGTASWKDQNDAAWTASDLVVPGDTVTRTQSFDFVGTGKNLTGAIVFAAGAETDGPAGAAPFGDALDINITVDGDAVTPGTDWCWEFNAPISGTRTVDTTVDFVFKDVDDQVARNARTTLGQSTFTITQGATCPTTP